MMENDLTNASKAYIEKIAIEKVLSFYDDITVFGYTNMPPHFIEPFWFMSMEHTKENNQWYYMREVIEKRFPHLRVYYTFNEGHDNKGVTIFQKRVTKFKN